MSLSLLWTRYDTAIRRKKSTVTTRTATNSNSGTLEKKLFRSMLLINERTTPVANEEPGMPSLICLSNSLRRFRVSAGDHSFMTSLFTCMNQKGWTTEPS